VLALVLAALLRSAPESLPNELDVDWHRYGVLAASTTPGLLLILWLRGAYDRRNLLGGPEEYARITSSCTYGMLLVIAAIYLDGASALTSRGWLLVFWVLAIMLVGAGRFSLRRVAYRLRAHGWFVHRVLIAGVGDQGLSIAQQLHGLLSREVELIGFLDDYLSVGSCVDTQRLTNLGESSGAVSVVGHPREARALAAQYECDLLIIVPTALTWESQQSLAELGTTAAKEFEVRVAPTAYDLTPAGVQPAPLGYIPLLRFEVARIVGIEAVARATVDFALAALLLAVSGPALAWLVCSARLRAIRPILMRRQVLGQGGRKVTLSLLSPRVTQRVLLRGIPALLSVLRGDLAMVGPRPIPLEDEATYRPWSGLLLAVKPGLTGPWRLAGMSGSPEEMLLADVWWVRNWTVWQHLFVLFQTAFAVRSRTPAEHRVARWEAGRAMAGLRVSTELAAEQL